MGQAYFLGIDVGTSSLKVVVIDQTAHILGECSSSYRLITPSQNEVQIDTENLWDALWNCLKSLFQDGQVDPKYLAGIGISSLCPGLTAFDEQGRVVVDPIIYSDRRSIAEAEWMKAAGGEERVFGITANNIMAGAISGTSMLWVKNNHPDIYEKIQYFGHVNTLLAQRMTGNYAIDYSNASYTGLFETVKGHSGQWSQELCDVFGIDKEKLPPLLASTDVVGGVIHPNLIALGIPEGTSVVIGGGDTACATFASGVTGAGDVCESVGTTNVLTICVDEPKFDRSFINRCHVVKGTWIYQGALSHTGSSYQWFRDQLCPDLMSQAAGDSKETFRLLNEEAEQSLPGANGVVFLPYMLGERSPIWDPYARGVFFGMSLHTTRADLNRAVMEGCGYGLRQLCEIAQQVTGRTFESFCSIGGGAKSEIWSQIKADITGRNIQILDLSDMAPVGAALLAAVGTGHYQSMDEAADSVQKSIYKEVHSNQSNQEVYDRRYQVYTGLYPQIKELFKVSQA